MQYLLTDHLALFIFSSSLFLLGPSFLGYRIDGEKTEPFVSVVLRFKLCYAAYQSPLLAQPEPRLFSAIVLSIIKLTFLPLSSNALCCQVGHMGHLCPKEKRIYYRPI